MNLFKAINERRSIRSYTQQEVTEEEINTLLEAAIQAPSGKNRQTWRFVIVRNSETIEAMCRAASSTCDQPFVKEAPVIIVVCADLRPYARLPYRERGENLFAIQNTAAAIQNLLLAVTAIGLGACWVGLFDERMVRETLNLPEEIRPVALIPVGHTNVECTGSKINLTPRKPLEEVVCYEAWHS